MNLSPSHCFPNASGNESDLFVVDIFQIYQGLDIITNKVTPEERQLAPHHMIDCASPLTRWTVVDFRRRTLPIVSLRNVVPFYQGNLSCAPA